MNKQMLLEDNFPSTQFPSWSDTSHSAMALESVHLLIGMATRGGGVGGFVGCRYGLSDYSVIEAEQKMCSRDSNGCLDIAFWGNAVVQGEIWAASGFNAAFRAF